jgi:hypothetical protein
MVRTMGVRFSIGSEKGFLFCTASRPVLGPTQSPIRQVMGAVSPGVHRPGHESDHPPPSSVAVKNEWRYTSTPPYAFMAWCLVTHKIRLHDLSLTEA